MKRSTVIGGFGNNIDMKVSMTEERKEQLRDVLESKQRNGNQAAAAVLRMVESFRESLDPSEFFFTISALAEKLRTSEVEAEDKADSYEIDKYGVELRNLDGQWDEPLSIVDARTKPWDSPEGNGLSILNAENKASKTAQSDIRQRLPRFGAATGLLFADHSGAVEIALAPLEIKRLLETWSVQELASQSSDAEVLRALHFLMEKTYTKAPSVIVEAPIASSGRTALVPDLQHRSKSNLETGEDK